MKKFIFLILIISAGACAKPTPKGVLNEEEMAAVLVEMHIVEAKISNLGISQDSAKILQKIMLKDILAERKIPESAYYDSYDYYLENLTRFEKVYGIVVDSLNLREKLARSSKEE